VDCGQVGTSCETTARVDEVVACLRDTGAAGMVAKARQLSSIYVDSVYAIDGGFLWVTFEKFGDLELWEEQRCEGFTVTADTCPTTTAAFAGTGCVPH
jgi:hypothetical protein